MTNEEKTLEQIRMQKQNAEDCLIEFDVLEFLEKALEENTKLKAEIDRLNTQIAESNKEGVSILHDMLELREENERLRRETENITSHEQFEKEMKILADINNDDTEIKHVEMDSLMCKVLTELGYGSGVDIFLDSDKWYA